MTKKQQIPARSFGKRSLSVILALLMVLSTFAVMLTATSITANAAISYWYVAGDFNGWSQTSNNKINGSSGSVTIPITASSIEFKMVAYEDGDKWCGNSSGSLTNGVETQLQWNSGNNIKMSLPANTVSVTFTLSVKNGNNYVTATANTKAPDPDPPVVGDTTFTAKVNESNPANTRDNIFWAEATYYDYLSDTELSRGWLYPDHVGTSNFNGNIDEWYPFYTFNRNVVKSVADSNYAWAKPLYFGNFCNTYGAYDTSHHPGVTNGFNDATGSYNVTRFNYAANNSNGVYDSYTSVQGLMGSTLKNGKLQTPDGTLAPYFNEAILGSNARVVKSAFPFRKTVTDSYTVYEFDSNNAKDNVYFTWETSGGRSYPKYVNYGAGTTYGVKDGLKEFMNTTSGYGIFPFNNASSNYKGTKTYTNEQLDYGFGIRMDMKFRVPKDQDVEFEFTGDDDLWMYITDEKGNSQLVLDMGGAHKQSHGTVNFNSGTATVDKVDDPTASNKDIWIKDEDNWGSIVIWAWDASGNGEWYEGDGSGGLYRFRDTLIGSNGNPLSSKTKFQFMKDTGRTYQTQDLNISDRAGKCSYTNNYNHADTNNVVSGHSVTKTNYFNFDPNQTYTMTIFYMERGLIESNCSMSFTLTPLGNNFIVTETVETANVNKGLQEAVRQRTSFDFTYNGTKTGGADINGKFDLGDGDRIEIPDTEIGIEYNVNVTQSTKQNTDGDYLVYDTTWDYWDNVNGKKLSEIKGTDTTGNGSSSTSNTHKMIDPSTGDPYDYAELQVNYVNTPQVTDVYITKVVDDPGVDHSDEKFWATVYLQFGSTMTPTAFDLETSEGDITAGRIQLQAGKTITIPNVPVGTHVTVVEDPNPNYTASYSPSEIVVGTTNTLTVTNTPVGPATGALKVRKYITMPSGDKGLYENGSLFTFKVEGLGSVVYENGKASESAVGMDKTLSQTSINGEVTFSSEGDFLKFTKTGTYIFKVYETSIKNVGTYNTDISLDSAQFLVRFDVTSENGALKVSGPIYYSYDGGTINANSFTAAKKITTDIPEFNNPAKPASVTIKKTDGAGKNLDGVTFNIYKVDGDGGEIKEANAIGAAKTTDANGICTFNNLDIFKKNANGRYSANPEYQWYALQETRAKDGYAKSKVIKYFTLPMMGDDGKPQYDITFDYVNGAIKNPDTAGPGMMALRFAGLAIILFATALLTYYVLRNKRRIYQLIAAIK